MIKFLNIIKSNWVALSTVILSAVTVVSLLPLESLPPAPGNDKIQHFAAYAILAIPVALRKPRRWMFICLLFAVYSGAIELIQPYINRYCDIKDLLANTAGVAIGMVVAGLLNKVFPVKAAH